MLQTDKGYGVNAWIKLIFLALTWGSSFILMKRGLFDETGAAVFEANQMAALRIGIASLCLIVPALRGISKVKRKHILPLLVVGYIGSGFPAFMFATAQTHLNSSTAGILNALTPLFTLLIGAFIFGVLITKRAVSGIFIGLTGAVGLVIARKGFDLSADWYYAMLIIVATVFYGTSVNTIKQYLTDLKPIEVTGMAFFFVLPPAWILIYMTGVKEVLEANPAGWSALGYVAILAIVGTAIAVVIFNYLIKETSALFASSVTYLMPIIATVWGLLDGESFSWMQAMAALLVLLGVYLVNYQPKTVEKV